MAIIYKKISEKQEKWGLDVTVEFMDDVTKRTLSGTFRFNDKTDATLEFDKRMEKAITSIEEKKIADAKNFLMHPERRLIKIAVALKEAPTSTLKTNLVDIIKNG